MIDFSIVTEYWPYFARGVFVTLQITALGCAIGVTLGTLLGIIHAGDNKFARFLVTVFVTLFRGTPMLIQIAFAVFVLPQLGIGLSEFWAVIAAVGFNSAAYVSQIIKSGIASVGKGQIEAAQVLGFTPAQTTRYIVLPQAVRVVLPALGNEFVTLIKESSLASTVGVMELSRAGRFVTSTTFDALTVYAIVAALYLLLTSSMSLLVSLLAKRMSRDVGY